MPFTFQIELLTGNFNLVSELVTFSEDSSVLNIDIINNYDLDNDPLILSGLSIIPDTSSVDEDTLSISLNNFDPVNLFDTKEI